MKVAKTLPHDKRAEDAVIGSVILEPELLQDVVDKLSAEDFYQPLHKDIFKAFTKLSKASTALDDVTLTNAYCGKLTNEVLATKLLDIAQINPVPQNWGDYADILKEVRRKRNIIQRLSDWQNRLWEKDDTSTSVTGEAMDFFTDSEESGGEPYLESSSCFSGLWEDTKKRSLPEWEETDVFTSGIKALDQRTGGVRLGCMDVIAARPSVGKTSLGLGIMYHLAHIRGMKTLILSLELPQRVLSRKLLSMGMNYPYRKLERPKNISATDMINIKRWCDKLGSLPILVNDYDRKPDALSFAIRKASRQGVQCVMLDYLNLVDVDQKAPLHQSLGNFAQLLASLAKSLNIYILCMAQLNRGIDQRQEHQPVLADLKSTSDIEQSASIVSFVHRPTFYNPDLVDEDDDIEECELIVAKNRYGETGKVPVEFVKSCTLFRDRMGLNKSPMHKDEEIF